MKIKSNTGTTGNRHAIRSLLSKIRSKRFLLVSILMAFLAVWSLVMIYYGMRLYKFKQAESINDLVFDIAAEKTAFIPNYFKGVLAKPEKLFLDIKFEDLQKIAYFREVSLERGKILPDVKQESMKAKIRHRGETYSADLKLTGANLDHVLNAEKISFRTKIKKGKTLMGMREFTLLVPKARGYLSEWIGHELERREDLISLRYDFVDVTINGKHVGLYCIEEHYDKRLVESNRFREGLLFKPTLHGLDVYNRKKIITDPVKNKQYVLLGNMWQAFLAGEMAMGDLFDLNKLAMDFAITDLIQGHHSKYPNNTRYYFNPVTNLVEPATREWGLMRHSDEWRGDTTAKLFIEDYENYSKAYYERFFADLEFVSHYIQALDRVSRVEYLDNFFDDIRPQMETVLSKIYQANPYYSYPWRRLYNNQKVIQRKIRKYDELVIAHLQDSGEKLRISVTNPLRWPITLERATLQDSFVYRVDGDRVLPPLMANTFREIIFVPEGEMDATQSSNDLKLYFRVVGMDSLINVRVLPVSREGAASFAFNPLTTYSDLSSYDWIDVQEEKKMILLRSGTRVLEQDLVISPGYTVVAESGLVLDERNQAKIVSHSALEFRGGDDNPISFVSGDSTGQGIIVLNAPSRSYLTNVSFGNLANPTDRGWTVTGAVTFYQSDVDLINCSFQNNRTGDDYLNIIRADFEMLGCIFEGVIADALDADFCTGRIRDASFTNIGNDAIDISGSQLDVTGLYLEQIGDKGLSAGEYSRMKVRNAKILGAEIAVCSKDKSELNIEDSSIGHSRVAFAAFQKKAEYGGSKIRANRITIDGQELLCLADPGSQVFWDGSVVPSDRDNVMELLYGAEYGKASK